MDQGRKSRSELLKRLALAEGFDRAGIATALPRGAWEAYEAWLEAGLHGPLAYMASHREARRNLESLLPGARSVLMAALGYAQEPHRESGWPRIARYALGRDYHKVLRSKLRRVAVAAERLLPGERFRAFVDSAPILERAWAQAAGIGWFGKNTCLIDSRFGSWFVIGGLATTADLEPDEPATGSCGVCRRCVDACPTGAIVRLGERWAVDSSRCISTLTIELRRPFTAEERRMVDGWTFGCDVCQEVCPFNHPRPTQPERACPTREPEFLGSPRWAPLEEAAEWSWDRWDSATRGSAVRRAGYEGWIRNVNANLWNQREKADPRQNGPDG